MREEILRLLRKLHGQSRRQSTLEPGALERRVDGSAMLRILEGQDRIRRRKEDLAAIKRLRARVELAITTASLPRGSANDQAPGPAGASAFGGPAISPASAPPVGTPVVTHPAGPAPHPEDVIFSGSIASEILSDMLQLASTNALTGLFRVENRDSGVDLFFDEGRIFHAVGPDNEGDEAFFAAFAYTQGSYTFRKLDQLPEQKTITASTQFLILEALRKIDEGSAE